jgi:hypothetical protein
VILMLSAGIAQYCYGLGLLLSKALREKHPDGQGWKKEELNSMLFIWGAWFFFSVVTLAGLVRT